MKKKAFILDIICLLLFSLFLYTGLSKSLDIERFRWAISKSPLLHSFSGWLPATVIGVELVVALLLVLPGWRLRALYASFGLMFLFTGYILFILRTAQRLPCSCGGVIQKLSWQQHLYFNIFFLLLALLGVILYDKEKSNIVVATMPSAK